MKKISIIGAGAVGRSIALALFYSGVRPAAVFSEKGKSAAKLAKSIKAHQYGSADHVDASSEIMIIAVPDNRITDVVKNIAAGSGSLKGKIIVHTSGALTSDELSLLRKKGASVGTFHPLQTFSKKRNRTSLKNVWCAVEGDKEAVRFLRSMARTLGANVFPISKNDKTLYHVAAVFASNYQVTLFSVVELLASLIGIPKKQVWKIFRPLIDQTLENVFTSSPAEALTGPIARGDYTTITNHLAALESSKQLEHLLPLYSTLGVETAKLAKRKK